MIAKKLRYRTNFYPTIRSALSGTDQPCCTMEPGTIVRKLGVIDVWAALDNDRSVFAQMPDTAVDSIG